MTRTEPRSLTVSIEDQVATVTLNRPDARNALSAAMIRQLRDTMALLEKDDSVRGVVLTGAGSAFCAGLDLKELRTTGENLRETSPDRAGGRPWAPLSKPVVAAVNGAAYTGGLEIALSCDVLIASAEALFADTHVRVGVMPGWGLSVLLPAAVGEYTARAISLAGVVLDAEGAMRRGLILEVVDREDLVPRARELVLEMAVADRDATAALLDIYRSTAGMDRRDALMTEIDKGQRWLKRQPPPAEKETGR